MEVPFWAALILASRWVSSSTATLITFIVSVSYMIYGIVVLC